MNNSIDDGRREFAADTVIPARWTFLSLLLAVAAYAPAVNNGFISDDFVLLGRLDEWLKDLHLISFPPEGIRLTTYLSFALLRSLFGYRPELYYAFTILLHLLNIWLLGRLLLTLTGRQSLAIAGIILFATVQNPQEAVMWIAAIGDAFVGLFTLAALLCWARERYGWCVLCYCGALLSKESGPVLLALLPLCDWMKYGRFRFRVQYLYLFLPTVGFLALFAAGMRTNTYITTGYYVFRPAGILIILNSMHRLAFPWLYLALLTLLPLRWRKDRCQAAAFLAWIFITLAPYSFITYQNHVPSRGQYLAAMGLAGLIALLLESLPRRRLRYYFLAAFAVVNIGYLWLMKDRQYRIRAAPTTRLLEHLRSHRPQCLEISNFPLNPWIAKDAALHVPGWNPAMLRVNETADTPCDRIGWSSGLERYEPAPKTR